MHVEVYTSVHMLPAAGIACLVLGPPLPALNATQILVTRDEVSDLDEDRVVIDAIVEFDAMCWWLAAR